MNPTLMLVVLVAGQTAAPIGAHIEEHGEITLDRAASIGAHIEELGEITPDRASPIGAHIEELGEITLDRAAPVVEAFLRALEKRTGRTTRLDDPAWTCEAGDRCADEIRARTGAEDVVLIRILAGPTKIHLVATRRDERRSADRRAEAHLSTDRGPEWDRALEQAAAALFPEPPLPRAIAKPPSPEVAAPLQPKAEAQSTLRKALPWAALGAGLIAGVAGAGFAAGNRDARAQIRAGVLTAGDYEALSSRARADGLWADVLIGASAAGLIAAITLFLVE